MNKESNKALKILLLFILVSLTNVSVSQVVVPFKQRTSIYTPDKRIYSIRGDFQMIGNTNMTLQNYSNTAPNSNNQMIYVDIDGDPGTINSSSAELNLSSENGADPTCSNIIYAGLYWTGRAHEGGSESPLTFQLSGQNIASGTTYNGYTLTIEQTGGGILTTIPRYATYTFTPVGGGDAIVFRYNTWSVAFLFWQSSLTVQIGSGYEIGLSYTESQGASSVANLRTPFLLDAGIGAPFHINSFQKRRDNNSISSSNFFVTTAKQLDKRQVKIKHASAAGYQIITAKAGDIYYPTNNVHGYMYAGYAEVTDYVKQHGVGNYTIADIALREGNGGGTGFYGGWGMVVIYENSKMTWRDVTVFDGYAYVAGGSARHELPVSGFNTARSGPVEMKLGIIAGEGDRDITGDYFEIRPQSAPNTWMRLGHSGAPVSNPPNFFNSSIQTGGNARNPNLLNNTGLDIAMFNIDNSNNSVITNNQTSTTFRYGSTQDTYIIPCIAMAVDAYVPAIETTSKVTEVNGAGYSEGTSVLPGDEIVIELEMRNKGSELVRGLEYVLPIPYTTTFVEASAIYAAGVSGTVTHDPARGATGAVVWNVGDVLMPEDNDIILAKLTYKLKVTTDCFILSNPLCPPSVTNEGVYTGVGVTSGIAFSNDRFVLGYRPHPCTDEPIYGTLSTRIDRDAFIMANCNGGVGYDNRTFYYCDEGSTTIPFAVIANNFPAGTKFYDDIEFLEDPETGMPSDVVAPTDTANVFTQETGFPKAFSGPYYAIPPGQANTCYWEFDIQNISKPVINTADTTIYARDTIDLNGLVILQGGVYTYTNIFYNNAAGTEIIPSPLVSPDTTRSYWVRAHVDNSSCFSDIEEIVVTVNYNIEAVDDYAATFGNVIIDVLANDILDICERGGSLEIGIVTDSGEGPFHGTVVLNADSTVKYVSNAGYSGEDSFRYYIKCITSADTATVYINVVESPDNISDADCFVDPSVTTWDIEMKKMSSVPVHYLSTPFAGDLDGDGRIEVVAPGVNNIGHMSNTIHVFDDSLKLIRTVLLESNTPQYGTTNLLIADVDNDGYGEFVVGTEDKTLLCYSHTGVKKWGPSQPYNAINGDHSPSLIIADVNGDGHAEILAVDKIYDAATGNLLVTLPPGGRGYSAGGPMSYMPVFADVDNDGVQEVVAGNTVYKITINHRTDASQNSATILSQMPGSFPDGFTSVADIDGDGDLDVIVTGGTVNSRAVMYVWDGATAEQIGDLITVSSSNNRISRTFVGDITGTGRPDIAFTYTHRIVAYSYDDDADVFVNVFSEPTTDASGATTMSMFDFNHDGEVELVYRDQDSLRIVNKYGQNIAAFECYSGTHTEYPIIVDLDRDGHADILVSGATSSVMGEDSSTGRTHIMHFGSKTPNQWARARSVWNQHAYSSVNVNDDLTIPRRQLNPATAFPGTDGILGNADDVYPFNNFLQQQTHLNTHGMPLWQTPDIIMDEAASSITVSGNSIIVKACFKNVGDAPIGSPVFATLYRNVISPGGENIIAMDSANIQVGVDESGCVTVVIPNGNAISDMYNIVVRINDKNGKFPYQAECDSSGSVKSYVNPLLMRKDATLFTLPPLVHNGTYPNPVSIFGNEVLSYEVSAVNPTDFAADIVITDTLPAYLDYVPGTASPDITPSETPTPPHPARQVLKWRFPAVPSQGIATASFHAMPQAGAVASQPLFINRATISIVKSPGDTVHVQTNGTYHQGAGISIMTFSAGLGGNIYNASEQALDYMATPSPGVLIAPNEGYRFAGWSHYDYVSLRGVAIKAREGIMHYDTLTVYGNVELHANFVPVEMKLDDEHEDAISDTDEESGIWAFEDDLFIKTSNAGGVVKIYSTSGVLQKLHTIISSGETKIKLPRGVYVVTINNGVGQLVRIE